MKSFGGVRRTAAAWVALVVAMSGLMAIGGAAPATAAPSPCVVEVGNFSSTTLPFRPPGTDDVAVAVLTITLPRSIDQSFQPRSLLMRAAGQNEIARLAPDSSAGTYTFSSQVGTYSDNISEPGPTYFAPGMGALLNNYQAGAPVSFRIQNNSTFETREVTGFWRLEITFRDCDTDDDRVADRAVDNCDGLSNPDQRDFDADGAGDACDPDADGDGAVDTSDNCTMLNNDQADADGDGIGNACDSTPYPPPAPAPPPVPATPGTPGTTTGPITVNPVASARTVALRYAKKKRVFKGSVGSAVGTCVSNAEVSLWRKKRGADRRLIVATTNDLGKFRTPRVRRTGKYYVTVRSIDSICAAVRSPSVRVRRR